MIYQCTKDMLKALKVDVSDKPDIYNELFSWNVKLLKFNRRNLVYLMNDATKLSVILYGLTSKEFKDFDIYVKNGIKEILEDCGVSNDIISQYIDQAIDPIFTSIGTRKQMGSLNRATMDIEWFWEDYSESSIIQRKLSESQNRSIFKNDSGNYVTPKDIVKNLLERTFSSDAIVYDLENIAIYMFSGEDIEFRAVLNIRDGSIGVEESLLDDFDICDDEDCIFIPNVYFDFFHHFNRFSQDLTNAKFLNELERDGHGRGAIRRIKDLLDKYPEIQEKWYKYKDNVEKEAVEDWLRTEGLM